MHNVHRSIVICHLYDAYEDMCWIPVRQSRPDVPAYIWCGVQECHCMLFLTPDNDFSGEEQDITLDEIKEVAAM